MSLERLDLTTFMAGLNLRAGEFQLQDGESPDLLNIEVDPVSGFFARPGWYRWNALDIESPTTWDPRMCEASQLKTGETIIYITSSGTVYSAGQVGVFADLAVPCNAQPHLADFAFWGDVTYMATGKNADIVAGGPTKRSATDPPAALLDASNNDWNDDYTVPIGGRGLYAEFCETHAGYLFYANLVEAAGPGAGERPNRIRWSHPNEPEDFAQNDYIDIDLGGGRITGLQSFNDHLLIFKENSLWALYGYDLQSWQLVQLSHSLGTPGVVAIAKNESTCFFFSGAAGSGIFAYDGAGIRDISEALRPAMDEVGNLEDIWLGWIDRRLWVATDWRPGDSDRPMTGAFVWDPMMGGDVGSWVYHEPAVGKIRSIVEGSDSAGEEPLIVLGDDGSETVSCLVRVRQHHGRITVAQDQILQGGALSSYVNYYVTRWLHGEWPERLKSWLRPRFVARRMDLPVSVRVDVYKDYNTNIPSRSGEGQIAEGTGSVVWRELGFDDPAGGGFDWTEGGAADASGRGANWTEGVDGSSIGRVAQGWGPARAVQLKFSNATDEDDAGRPWAMDAIFLKFKYRRFTT